MLPGRKAQHAGGACSVRLACGLARGRRRAPHAAPGGARSLGSCRVLKGRQGLALHHGQSDVHVPDSPGVSPISGRARGGSQCPPPADLSIPLDSGERGTARARVCAATSQVAERGCVSASQGEAWRPIGQPGCTRVLAHTHWERRPVEREVRTRRRWSGSMTAGGSTFVMIACMAVTSTVATA